LTILRAPPEDVPLDEFFSVIPVVEPLGPEVLEPVEELDQVSSVLRAAGRSDDLGDVLHGSPEGRRREPQPLEHELFHDLLRIRVVRSCSGINGGIRAHSTALRGS